MSDVLLRAEHIRRSYGDEQVLAGIDLELREREFMVVLGPSGCGKTTLLNILAGFDRRGLYERLELAGDPIRESSEKIGVIFQEGSLFPWLTIEQNILFGSAMRALKSKERDALLREYLVKFKLEGLERKYPDQISGGQQQRAAVARALINGPIVLLADEPFRALDSQTRLASQVFLWSEINRREQAVCLITHDIDEALLLGDRLVLLTDRPTRVRGEFRVELPHPRKASTVLSDAFHLEKSRFVDYCRELGLPLFPDPEA